MLFDFDTLHQTSLLDVYIWLNKKGFENSSLVNIEDTDNTEDTERILIILRILRGYWENWGYWENTENTEDTHPLHPAPFTRFHSQSDAPLYSKDNPPTLTIATSIYLTNCKQPPSGLGEGQAYLFRVGNSVTGVRGGGTMLSQAFPLTGCWLDRGYSITSRKLGLGEQIHHPR